MGTALRFHPFPRMWDLESRVRVEGTALRIGERRMALGDVCAVSRVEVTERDEGGLMLIGLGAAVAGTVLVVLVMDFGWQYRFYIGAALFFALALVSLAEARQMSPIRFQRLRIVLRDGEVVYTTADPADAARLETVLSRRAGAQAGPG